MKRKKKKKPTSKKPILAAGGIVTRGKVRPLFAVVRLRRQKSWVLPKGKLNPNETAFAAARREAIEETGHDVKLREFLGSLAYQTAVRPKIVRFWRMEASGRPVAKLMKDVSAVRWLPLSRAVGKLTHEHEKEFLAKVGPHALASLRGGRYRPRAPRGVHPSPPRRSRALRPKVGRVRRMAASGRPAQRPVQQIHGKLAPARLPSRPFVQALWRWLGR